MTFTSVFGGQNINPANLSFLLLEMTESQQLQWPIETNTEQPVMAQKIDVDAAAGLEITLPDATLGSTGADVWIANIGAEDVDIVDFDGGAVGTVATGEIWIYYLRDNTTEAGSWGSLQAGSTVSQATAAALAGKGLKAITTTLNQDHPVTTFAGNRTSQAADRAQMLVFTGGTQTLSLDPAATLGNGWFTVVRNAGTGLLTINPDGAELIDGEATLDLGPGQSLMVVCSGTAFWTQGQATDLVIPPGSEGSPGAPFAGDPDTGIYQPASDYFGISAGGAAQLVAGGGQVLVQDGSDTNPSLSFMADPNSGFYSQDFAEIGLTLNESRILYWSSQGSLITTGTAAAPSYSFLTDPETGTYLSAVGRLGLGAAGAEIMTVDDAQGVITQYPINFVVAGGTANAITLTYDPPVTDLHNGMVFWFEATDINTSNMTVNINGLGAKTLCYNPNTASSAPQVVAGQMLGIVYDETNDNFQIVSRMQFVVGRTMNIFDPTGTGTCVGFSSTSGATFSGSGGAQSPSTGMARIWGTHASFDVEVLQLIATRAANSAYSFLRAYSGGSGGDLEFRLSGDGNGTCDGNWTGGGADVAELMETDPAGYLATEPGISVVIEDGLVREAREGELPVGITRPKRNARAASLISNAPVNWPGKYLTDEFGRYEMEEAEFVEWRDPHPEDKGELHQHYLDRLPNGVVPPEGATVSKVERRKLNPQFDPTKQYVERQERNEWALIGLRGRVPILKGQVLAPHWVKIRDLSERVSLYLI